MVDHIPNPAPVVVVSQIGNTILGLLVQAITYFAFGFFFGAGWLFVNYLTEKLL